MKKLMYILLFLLIAANVAAQKSYVIDEVCTGANRFYRIDTKERGSTWEWHVKDTLGNEIANPPYTEFWIESSPGDTLWGSEINYFWNDTGVYQISTLHYSEHGCDTLEQGIVNVYEKPGADAGNDIIICLTSTVIISTDTAWSYSSLIWTTTGDGTFANNAELHPTYFPGTTDIISGSVTLILTANGKILSATCEPAVDSLKVRFSNPVISLSKADLLCYNDSSGWISANVSGGIEPYIYSWTGPGIFTSSGDSIYGLAAGKYLLLVTDSIGCTVTDSVEISEPLELLVSAAADTTEMCEDGIISLNATAAGGTGSYTHLWTGTGAVYLDATDTISVFFQGAIAGFYTLIYNVTDENGCITADTVEVTVLPKDTIVVDTIICGTDAPFAWLGKTHFDSGQYTDTLESLVACDTIIILNLIVLPIDTIKVDTIICISDTPFAWYGKDYFTTGIYTDTLSPLIGCDTILMLDLTVLPIDTITFDTTICGLDAPFAWYGKDYFLTGIYTDTLPAMIGCDTILILDLTVLPIDTLKLDTVICGNEVPFVFNGKDYFTTNIYTDTLISTIGCDSILILDLTVLPIDTITFDTTICGMDVPLAWLGNDYFITGTYIDTIIAATGCDTIAILNLTVLPIDTLVTDTVVCGNEVPFAWNGADYFISGEYIDTLVSATGCDSILVLNLTVLPIDTIKVDTIICISDTPFAWYGKDYFTTGIYTDTLSPLIGCDTILVLDLTVLPIDTITFDTTICGLDAPFAWYGKDYFLTGIYTDTLPAMIGCDTILILDLTVLPIDTLKLDTVICGNEVPFVFNGKDYFTTNIYTDTLISTIGCDSILILDLTVLPIDTITFDTTICGMDVPLAWLGNDYFITGTYIDTIIAATGCDTIAILNLTVLPIDTLVTDTVVCGNEVPFAWNGADYFISGEYIDTLVSATGCDSILVLNLTVLPIDTIKVDTIICISDTPFAWYGKDYFTTGIYTDTLSPLIGCDTILVLDLTVLPIDTITFDTTICGLDAPFAWYGKDYFLTGIYTDTLPAMVGCDTILILDLTVLPIDTITIDTIICASDLPFSTHGLNYYTTDIYTNTLVSATGCDTILIVDLTVLPGDTITFDTVICGNEVPLAWYGNNYFTTGVYIDTLISALGCDTIAVLNLTVLPIDTINFDTTICVDAAPFVWYGQNYFATGIYIDTLISAYACDTILILDLTVLPKDTISLDTIICENETPFAWYGKDYLTTGIYIDTLLSLHGCDTLVILDLTVLPTDTIRIDTTICESDVPYAMNGKNYYDTDTYIETLVSASGCDSIVILNLEILPNFRDTVSVVICESNLPYLWDSLVLNTVGIYSDTLANTSGCDSVFTIILQTVPEFRDTVSFIVCESSLPYSWESLILNTAGTYSDTLASTAGCDSILTIILQTVPEFRDTVSLTVCESSLPYPWESLILNTAGTYSDTLVSVAGCDSILTIILQTVPEFRDTVSLTVCESSLPYSWESLIMNTAGTYSDTLVSKAGCDSILTIILQTVPEFRDTVSLTVCETDLPYLWETLTLSAAGTYSDTLVSTAGCDSIRTIILQTLPELVVDVNITADKLVVDEGESVTFTASPVNGGTNPVYRWYVNNVEVTGVNISTYTYVPDDKDEVYVVLVSDLTCATNNPANSNILTLTVNTVVPPPVTQTDTIAICIQDVPLVWNGNEYKADGLYSDTLTTAAGADSIVQLRLILIPEIKPSFDQIGPYCQFAIADVLPLVSKEGITGTWSQTEINTSNLGSQLIIFTPDYGQCAVSVNMEIDVTNNITPTIAGIGPFCQNSMAPPLPTVTLNNVKGTWSPSSINTQLVGNRTYRFMPDAGQCSDTVEIDIEILPFVIPTFNSFGTLCQNSIAPALPSVSNNGVTGIWDPAIIDTKVSGTFTYLFNPVGANCAVPVTMTIFVSPEITPEFVQIGPLCQNSVPPALPSVSTNGISGTWNPPFIDTKVSGLFTYTFTPFAGQCAVPTTMVIEIVNEITPVFAAIGPFCQNSIVSALPLVSENGISGSWSPSVINTSVIGFASYTFTPDPGQCAVATTISIEITDQIKPVFAAIGPYCQYSVASALPLVSQNGINGTWLPDTILTTNTGTISLKFIPDPDQCAAEITVTLEILPEITPVFVQLGPLCQNSVAPVLPAISSNGIQGSWSPAVIDTQFDGKFDYIFTPDTGYCAVPVTMTIVINPKAKPVFTQIGPLCQYSPAPALPVVSSNGVQGTWSPSVIDTKTEGIFTFIFTPAAVECAIPDTMTIEITPEITPEFVQLGPLCQNSVAPLLPAVSINGITGSWSPAIIDTKAEGTFTFTFTPAPVYCAVPVTMNIEITEEITPVFEAFDPICPNSIAPLLPSVSTNGIKGTWDPAVIETDKQGIFTFTFTPDSGLCATKTTIEIEITDEIPPVAISRNIRVFLDADGKASVTTAQINRGSNDNCELDTLYLSRYDFGCDDIGANPVTLTAVDAVGLIGTTKAIVTVIDTISPVVICRGPFEIQLDENAEYKLTVVEVLESVDDNCQKIDTMWVFPHELDCDNIGLTTITLMVTDVNGNSSYCQTEVMIYGNRPPMVVDDSAKTIENVPVVIDIVENDYDEKTSIDISSLAISIKPRYGTVTVNPVNGDITYTPNRNFSGVDVLQYRICDDGIPCEPECGTAFVYIVVEPVNDKPLAVDDYYIAGCYSVVENVVLDNDTDDDGSENLRIDTNPLSPPNHGELIIDPDGTISYFPNEGYIGIDSFQYVIWDNGIPESLSDTAWVYIEVDCSEETQDPLDCELFIPEGFSPNQDGIHDFFRIMCIHNYPDAKLMIFNRNGDLLWQKQNYGNYDVWGDQYNAWWWGTSVLSKFDVGRQMINGEPKLKVGNYIYVLDLGNGGIKNGTVMISY
jgi:gliding motility-associated-like protein